MEKIESIINEYQANSRKPRLYDEDSKKLETGIRELNGLFVKGELTGIYSSNAIPLGNQENIFLLYSICKMNDEKCLLISKKI